MRKGILLLVVLLVVIGFGLGVVAHNLNKAMRKTALVYEEPTDFPIYPELDLNGKTAEQMSEIRRGEYLVKAGDCISCHTNTPQNGAVFSGGLPIKTPFGTIFSPNITPDKKTGIGNWSLEEFTQAMQQGIAPDGHYYYPAFPYLYFQKITSADLKAIKVYLDNIPPIQSTSPENQMVWPFGYRFLQLGWRLMFFEKTESISPTKDRGEYLVEGLGHCGMCHTPSYTLLNKNYVLAAPINRYNLAGAYAQGYLAPNISQAGLGTVTDEELLKVFTDYQTLGKGKIHGPMVEAVHNSLDSLKKADLLAIIKYLKSVRSETPPIPVLKNISLGEVVYKEHCAVCHNLQINSAPLVGDTEAWKPLINSGMDRLLTLVMTGTPRMPAKGGCAVCTEEDIEAAVSYMIKESR